MPLTKTEARAVLSFHEAVVKACNRLGDKLQGSDLQYAQAYYLSHIKSAAQGQGYGSAPITQAREVLGLDD